MLALSPLSFRQASVRRVSSLACAAVSMAAVLAAFTPARAGDSKTLGFAVTTLNTAIYETRFMDECPQGINATNDEHWWRGLSKEDRGRLTSNGDTTQIARQAIANHRGPNGEDVCQVPTAVTDPPLYTVRGKSSYGMKLDGTEDGRDTPKSCKHEKFTGIDGTPGVDNQLYRLLGCVYGWRSIGHVETAANGHRQTNGLGMILIEVAGVDDPRNDDDVNVTFYRSVDQFTFGANATVLPYSTYRIDYDGKDPRYGDSLKGKIVDGVLKTADGGDVKLPFYGNQSYQTMQLKDARLEMKIAPDGASADGIIAGYYSTQQLWEYIGELGWQPTGIYTCPGIYAAMQKLADGHKDPKTGECTSISSAFKIKTVAGFIKHREGEPGVSAKIARAQP